MKRKEKKRDSEWTVDISMDHDGERAQFLFKKVIEKEEKKKKVKESKIKSQSTYE